MTFPRIDQVASAQYAPHMKIFAKHLALAWISLSAGKAYAQAPTEEDIFNAKMAKLQEQKLNLAEKGDAKAQFTVGFMLLGKDNVQAVEWLRESAEQGNVDAQNSLGCCYRDGKGVAANRDKASAWFRKAALQGSEPGCVAAQFNLSMLYLNATSSPSEKVEGIKWLTQAAENAHERAEMLLGLCYLNGEGVVRDAEKAVYWIKRSAQHGHIHACTLLASLYQFGHGVPIDLQQAVALYMRASKAGEPIAQAQLGYLYLNGDGLPQNTKAAVELFQKSAASGNPHALLCLGFLYQNGKGLEKNPEKAVDLYRRAAEKGFVEAQLYLGSCLVDGNGTPKDEIEGYAWLNLAGATNDTARSLAARLGQSMPAEARLAAQQRSKVLRRQIEERKQLEENPLDLNNIRQLDTHQRGA
jgi:TPR repeat protein